MNPGQPEWLYRHSELVLGPLTAEQLVQKLYSGEIDAKTPVQKMGDGSFRKLGEIDAFRVHVAKAEAKARVDAHAVTEAQRQKKKRNVKIGIAFALTGVVAVVAGAAAYQIAVDNPFKNVDEQAFGDIVISIEPGTISLARANLEDEEMLDYPLSRDAAKKANPALAANTATPKDTGAQTPKGTKVASAKATGKQPKVNDEGEEPDGLQMAKFDQSAINSVVAANQKSLYPCLVAEAQKNPGLSTKIPIEFVIGNDGKVAKVWVDHPSFKTGSLQTCLLQKLQAWKFKAYEGERATVSLSFKIGKG